MSTAWVAGSVRARAMSRRRLGHAAARELACRSSLELAVDSLAATPYGHEVHPGQDLTVAQHSVASTLLWHMRVLAGWVPHGDARVLRVLAGGFEVANVDERLREITGGSTDPAFRLGTLEIAWNSIARATSVTEIRECLTHSAWGDPGSDVPAAMRLAMRLSWAARVAASVPGGRPWAAGATAITVARELLVDQRPLAEPTVRMASVLIGREWTSASGVRALADALPADARWVFDGVDDPADLWRAEAGWWSRIDRDGHALLRRPVTTSAPVIGAVAVLAADAWRVRAALEVAARGGATRPGAVEAFDAVA
jgi:hypothetical protein